MPRINDLKKSSFLAQKDVTKPILVTIESYEQVNITKEGADEKMEWVISFREVDKPLILKPTNAAILGKIFGLSDNDLLEDHTIGKKVVLYIDPNVSYAGKITGGIRIRAPKQGAIIPQEPEQELTDAGDDIPF